MQTRSPVKEPNVMPRRSAKHMMFPAMPRSCTFFKFFLLSLLICHLGLHTDSQHSTYLLRKRLHLRTVHHTQRCEPSVGHRHSCKMMFFSNHTPPHIPVTKMRGQIQCVMTETQRMSAGTKARRRMETMTTIEREGLIHFGRMRPRLSPKL